MSVKRIFFTRFLLALTFFCGSAGTAYYVSHHYLHRAAAHSVASAVAVTNIKKDAFTQALANRLSKVAQYSPPTRQPIIFDNDAASDDVMALMLIGNDPRVDIKAITVAGTGEAHGEAGARNIADVTYLLGKETLPIAYGRSTPLSRAGVMFPESLRAFTDHLLDGMNLSHHPSAHISGDAVGLMYQVLSDSRESVTILATGPLTNVAELIKKHPDIKHKIKHIYIMGGAINVPGNIQGLLPKDPNQVSEWNFYADPEAVKIVFNARLPITLVSLDATNQVRMNKNFLHHLSRMDEPELKLVYKLHKGMVDHFGMQVYENEIYMWDALAAMVMLDPDIAKIKPLALSVSPYNGSVRRSVVGEQAALIDVVTTIYRPDDVLQKYIAITQSNNIYAQQKFHNAVWNRSASLTSK